MPTDSTLTPVNFTLEQETYLEQMREKAENTVKQSEEDAVKTDDKRKKLFNQKKFEEGCKRQSIEEKCRLVLIWCKKMIDTWQKDFKQARPDNYLNTPEGKVELGTL
jgi:hypothetical protein